MLSSWRELGVALGGIVSLGLVLLAGGSALGWLVAVIDSAVIVLVLTVVNTMIALVAVHRENRAERWRDAALPMGLGLAMAIAEVVGVALLRYFLARWLP